MPPIRKILFFAFVFLTIHALSLGSFFYDPARPVLYVAFVIAAIIVCIHPQYILLPILASILFDSSGHLFEWQGISLRLVLLSITMIAWFMHAVRDHTFIQKLKTWATPSLGVVFIIVVLAAYNGFQNGHEMQRIIGDAIPYLYLLLFYPIRDALVWAQGLSIDDRAWWAGRGSAALFGSILGSAILSVIVLFLFSSGLQEIQGPFYVWWRDWVVGKATGTGNGFFRIVSPLHLLQTALVPVLVYTLLFSERWQHRFALFFIAALTLIPALNFSRMYFLALIPATLVLAVRFPWRKVMATLILFAVLILSEYMLANYLASGEESFGFQFISKQSKGIIFVESEESTASRATILPYLTQKISRQPLIGEGLGATVTYFDPALQEMRTTPHLDWGFLELVVEFGALAALFLILCSFGLLWRVRHQPFAASIVFFLLFSTLTSPVLFHVLGLTLLAGIAALVASRSLSYGNDNVLVAGNRNVLP